ncbi:MAG: ring-cleaving dioxygenase [Balneolaceae bacterium]|nr:ring-cleaving dioxygenase [Balneolaceae bacterium]MBO6545317.1 ring-cleaving dioxygenase [Balneolaceae bacterium]MBO6646713.1 ring-cleaving dioxygenase [Balneolaceae bacterium]
MNHNKGLHHITVLAGDPKENADFYINTLGMRMVKKSVNQDDPGTYHLFYGNEAATPGSSLTFFPWPRAHKGIAGSGEAVNVAFKVPEGSKDFWISRLKEQGISTSEWFEVFGKQAIRFEDPDGLELDLVFDGSAKEKVSNYESPVPNVYVIQGFESTRLKVRRPDSTSSILEDIFEFSEQDSNASQTLYQTDARIGSSVIIESTDEDPGRGGRGIVHHVAFRAKDLNELKELREKVISKGLQPSEVIDRHWFKSVYFREPSGVLFEIATDGPGYAVDEDFEHLGEKLILTPWLEPRRKYIESILPKIEV